MSLFTDHPNSVGETYIQHFRFAVAIGGALVVAGLAAIAHAVFPFWFERTASRAIKNLYMRTHDRGVAAKNPAENTGRVDAA